MRGDVQTANNATATVQKAFDDYKIEREKTDADKARQNQSQLQAQVNLAEHYRQQADKLSGELLAKGKALTIAQQKLKEKIDELARKDGAGWTGIGPGALCLYQQNLGYPAGPGCSQYLSAANMRKWRCRPRRRRTLPGESSATATPTANGASSSATN
jgi:hypothetical protein